MSENRLIRTSLPSEVLDIKPYMGVQLEDEESGTLENNTQRYKHLYKRTELLIKISCFNFEKHKIKYCFSLCNFIWGGGGGRGEERKI
jgi:hypothetical protein